MSDNLMGMLYLLNAITILNECFEKYEYPRKCSKLVSKGNISYYYYILDFDIYNHFLDLILLMDSTHCYYYFRKHNI